MAEGCSSSSSTQDFSLWVKDQGGSDEFLLILREFGFNSKLSLSNLKLDLPDGEDLLSRLNCGQRCLLRGLIDLAGSAPSSSNYSGCVKKVEKVRRKVEAPAMRSKINQLFNYDSKSKSSPAGPSGSSSVIDSDDDFLPLPSFRPQPPSKRRKSSGKGKEAPGKALPMKKIKEARLKVVGLPWPKTSVPVGEEREKYQKVLWLRESASEAVIKKKIKDLFNWHPEYEVEYMYASGRHLRPASLEDVENSTSWDFGTLRALMGNGCLYVTKMAKTDVSSCSDDEEEKKKDDGIVESDKVERVKEMFSNISSEIVEETLENKPFDDAIEILMSYNEEKVGEKKKVVVISDDEDEKGCAAILKAHATKVIDFSRTCHLEADRTSKEALWLSAVAFYKSCSLNPEKLAREFMIRFVGEAGADSGSLKLEFFEDVIREANLNLLEGEDDCRIIKKDWGMESLYEMMGTLVAHSLLLNGPGLKCLSPTVYDYLTNQTTYPEVADIPLSLGTRDLISLITKLDNAADTDEIDDIMDQPTSLSIINSSGWSHVEPVTHANRYRLIQCLITEEVISKREKNMNAFFRGLNNINVGDLITAHPKKFKNMFVFQEYILTADTFMSLVKSLKPPLQKEAQAFEFFKEYVYYLEENSSGRVSLPGLLRFITGSSRVPPMGLNFPIDLFYQPDDKKNIFPQTQACFSKIMIPVCHDSKEEFFFAMTKALEYCGGYGNV